MAIRDSDSKWNQSVINSIPLNINNSSSKQMFWNYIIYFEFLILKISFLKNVLNAILHFL